MAKYTITPWRSQKDLLSVRSQLYHLDQTSQEDRRHAVDRVMAWKLRGNLPHAVESTALLIDAILHHNNPSNSIFSVRAVYSAAFTRFVTGFCDIGRNKERSLEPSSMQDIAKQIGMPVEFVALRHEATHEELPAIQRLVKASEDALQWLWSVYWSRLEEPETEDQVAASLTKLKTDARQILRNYRSQRREAVKAKKHKIPSEKDWEACDACVDLFGKNKVKMEAFVNVLIQDKLLSPSKRELGASLDGAYIIWDLLLQDVIEKQKPFAMVLIKSLLEAISGQSPGRPEQDAEKEALCMWVTHILHGEEWDPLFSTLEQRILRKDVMMWCCMHPGHWTHHLGTQVLEEEDSEFEDDWDEVFEASQIKTEGQGTGKSKDLRAPSPGFLEDVSFERFARDDFRKKPVVNSFGDTVELGSWVRAPTPSNAPIGVVR